MKGNACMNLNPSIQEITPSVNTSGVAGNVGRGIVINTLESLFGRRSYHLWIDFAVH